MTLIIGSDPEFFAGYTLEDGTLAVLPPVVLRDDFDATFEDNGRHPIFAHYDDTIVHEDGAAFEMSTPPVSDWKEMWTTIKETKEMFGKDVLSKFPVCNPMLYSLPSMHYQVERWLDRGEEFFMATRFGCDADQDVFNIKARCKVLDASKHPRRYAGGHIHISGLPEIEARPLDAIKSMVLTAGLAAIAYSDVPELEKERIFLYGKPGKFRIQNYGKLYKDIPNTAFGVEYRTPSTRWTDNYDLAEKIFSWVKIGMEVLLQRNLLAELEPRIMKDATKAIITTDQNDAKGLLAFIEAAI